MAYEEHVDPSDDSEGDPEEIDAEEREALQQDLVDVNTLKSVLASRGIKGVVVYCPDCEDDHFLGWDLLADNLRQILESGEPPVHEPAWEPDPDEYVTWDYALGFLDGYEAFTEDRTGEEACAWCGSRLPEGGYSWSYCPTCGRTLGPVNLMIELKRQGWSEQRIVELLERSGFDRPVFDPEPATAGEAASAAPPEAGSGSGSAGSDEGPEDPELS
ncbi:MAG TPA: DUF5319 family protein [Actinomycetota bacterium]|nr:DUF5319 family protein [Actinomycetota bacterium]